MNLIYNASLNASKQSEIYWIPSLLHLSWNFIFILHLSYIIIKFYVFTIIIVYVSKLICNCFYQGEKLKSQQRPKLHRSLDDLKAEKAQDFIHSRELQFLQTVKVCIYLLQTLLQTYFIYMDRNILCVLCFLFSVTIEWVPSSTVWLLMSERLQIRCSIMLWYYMFMAMISLIL